MKVFLAGIIQGSLVEESIHRQDYRSRLKMLLQSVIPDAEVFCPIDNHPDSLAYTDEYGHSVFHRLVEIAAASDVVLAYIPEASMGTAVEMWEARNRGKLVLTISPLCKNWVVKFLSHRVFSTMDEFEEFAQSGELTQLISSFRK